MAATNLDAQGGFVAAANMVQGAPAVVEAAAAAALGAPDVVHLVDGEAAPAVPQQGPMRWTNNSSGFVLRRMAQIVSERSRTDKTYKDKDVTVVAKALKEYSGLVVSATQVYNHLRKWKQKWSKIARLKDFSGATFDEDVHAIMLEQDHYLGYCKDHPKDAEFLNTPIRFYTEMETLFGSTLATGRFALGSNEPLGVNKADSVGAKLEGEDFTLPTYEGKTAFECGEASKATTTATAPVSESVCGNKRKRGNFTEEDMLMMTNMNDAINNVANAMLKIGAAHVDPDLYLAVMEMPDFSTEALIVAYAHLLENKPVDTGFVNMSTPHRAVWLRTYLSKNYFM
ncbi:unnamed protein product [Urochloa humidicola]